MTTEAHSLTPGQQAAETPDAETRFAPEAQAPAPDAQAASMPDAQAAPAPDAAASETSPTAGTAGAPAESGASETADEPSFAEMLARHEQEEAPQSRLAPGRRVTARIVAITGDTIFVSTGSKVDGIVEREEMEENGELACQTGDLLELYVVTVTPQEVKLSKVIRGAGGLAVLEEARDAALPVEGKVTAQVKGGYAVEIMKRRAFCPLSQIDLRPLEDPESAVGKIWPFLITRLEKGGRNIVVSRRSLLEREQAENREALLAEIHVDDVREGVVSRLAPFGAFVELVPNVEGLAHVSELSWTRVSQPDEAVAVGDRVRVKVLAIDREEKGTRISLSMRRVTEDPWKAVAERLRPGDVVTGKVVRNAPFGAFVEVLPGVEGLVHLSELSYEKRVQKADEVVVPGDHVTVKIKEVEPDKRRISLSLRDAAGDPWELAGDSLAVDLEMLGTVEKREAFGLFVTLSPGITGLLPKSAIAASPARKTLERLGAGEPVSVRIKEIDRAARRISLVPAGEDARAEVEEKDWKRHAPRPAPAPAMGALGMALQAAMKKKK